MASLLADNEMRALLAKTMAGIATAPVTERRAEVEKIIALAKLGSHMPTTHMMMPAGAAGDASSMMKEAAEATAVAAARAELVDVLSVIRTGMDDATPAAREAAFITLAAVATGVGSPAEPHMLPLLPVVLDHMGDKVAAVNTAAMEAARVMVLHAPSHAAATVLLPLLLSVLDNKKWQARAAALQLMALLPEIAPVQIAGALPALVPRLTEVMGEVRAEVAKAAEAAMLACCTVLGNKDVENLIPAIVSALARPVEVPECTHKLASTTFVQAVDAATLSVVTPILARGLAERQQAVRRRCAVVIQNFVKLVADPEHAAPLIPKLLPGLNKLRAEASDPELREVASRAQSVLAKAAGVIKGAAGEDDEAATSAALEKAAADAAGAAPAAAAKPAARPSPAKGGKVAAAPVAAPVRFDNALALPVMTELVLAERLALTPWGAAAEEADASPVAEGKGDEIVPLTPVSATTLPEYVVPTVEYVAALASSLADRKEFDVDTWHAAVAPYFAAYLPMHLASGIAAEVRATLQERVTGVRRDVVEEVEEGDVLCDCKFSLAYGAKILLHEAQLRLLRGKRYGLCGYNGCGKSTLMRAIANGQLEGFPSKDVLRTVYVEHDIQSGHEDMSVVDYVLKDETIRAVTSSEEEVLRVLESVGFNATMRANPITSLSGGWKMKLALARAMLQKADIYLLDEPTNHLDIVNVAWLTNFLISLTGSTCMIVSHDSTFLDKVCSHIIHYEGFHLKTYRGNLTELVKVRPEAKSYYDLSESSMKFEFPAPGYLEGVKSMDRAILRMNNVGFRYPTSDRQILSNVYLSVSLASRVVVLGANGAGKSTLIKLLTGELVATEGTVWRHPNMRIAYVAQHAFHHIEDHLSKTPNEYIQWRFASGQDIEQEDKETRKITPEEEEAMAKAFVVGGQKLVVEQLLARRKLRSSYEYEAQFVGQPLDKNKWLPRDVLVSAGFEKLVVAIDAREAAAAGLFSTPLTSANIARHLQGLGLDPEVTLHTRIAGLSGGQKLKLVLGAAMWMHPHVLVMDEPTNFLDRDSLGALAGAIKGFQGGVVLITHHHEFTRELCGESWLVADGKLSATGGSYEAAAVKAAAAADTVVDAAGNEIKVKAKLNARELKRKRTELIRRRKAGEDVEEELEDVEAQLAAIDAAAAAGK